MFCNLYPISQTLKEKSLRSAHSAEKNLLMNPTVWVNLHVSKTWRYKFVQNLHTFSLPTAGRSFGTLNFLGPADYKTFDFSALIEKHLRSDSIPAHSAIATLSGIYFFYMPVAERYWTVITACGNKCKILLP